MSNPTRREILRSAECSYCGYLVPAEGVTIPPELDVSVLRNFVRCSPGRCQPKGGQTVSFLNERLQYTPPATGRAPSFGPWLALNYANLPEGEVQFGSHQLIRQGARVSVFGNDRKFPTPSGKLLSAHIGLVDTDPAKSFMALPQGKVVVRNASTGDVIEIGEEVQAGIVLIETPNTGGVSNWAGIQLCFELKTP